MLPEFHELEFSLLIFAWRVGADRPTCMLSHDVGTQRVLVKSFVRVEPGEMMTFDFQLVTIGTVRASARVDQVKFDNGCWRCLVSFSCDSTGQILFRQYLERFAVKASRATGASSFAGPTRRSLGPNYA